MAYLDGNATEPLRPAARAALIEILARPGNPSAVHADGRRARSALESAREIVAARFGAASADVVFTSGGTESDTLAIRSFGAGRRILASAIEHDAVLAAAPEAALFGAGADGTADLGQLEALLRDGGGPALVCLMLANNETGVIQPVAEAARLCRAHGALLHVDAVQAAGRIPVVLPALGAHSLAVSSHKIGGPAGAGALILAPDAPPLAAHLPGGGQERGRRGGTPALAAIAGFAAACTEAAAGDWAAIAALRDAAEQAARAAGAEIVGSRAPRLPNTASLVLPGVRADTQVIALDLAGVSVSAGAACSSGKVATSRVLAAMGFGDRAGQAIRISLPWNATAEHITAFARAYAAMAARLAARPALPSGAD